MKLINLSKQAPSAKISKEILDAFIEEVNKIQEEISSHFELWKNDSTNINALKTVHRGFHTLRGNGYLMGASVVGELGWQCENLFNQIMEHTIERNELFFSLIERVQKMLPSMMEQFQKNQPVPYEIVLLISQISHFTKTKGQELGEFESPTDLFIQHLTHLKTTLEHYEKQLPLPFDPEIVKIFHLLGESSQDLGTNSLFEIITLLESYSHVLLEKRTLLTKDKLILFYKAIGFIERLLTGKNFDQEEQQALLNNTQIALSIEKRSPSDLSFFFDEVKKNLDELQALVNSWSPQSIEMIIALREQWKNLKHHAHQEGVMAIKELCHHLESVLSLSEGEPLLHQELKELTQMGLDELASMLEILRTGGNIEVPQKLIAQINQRQPKQTIDINEIYKEIYQEEIINNNELDELVQIKTTLFEEINALSKKLTHHRVYLEQQQAVVKNNLLEMEQIIILLRDQSQHLKIETQLLSYYRWINKVNEEELEPLKLYHFPLIQQLSNRFMASVNTLVNLQDSLKILAEQTDILLVQQTRMSAELQDTLLSIHKVPFWNILPSLQRVMRLLTKEFRSQIDFVVHGAHVKFERNLLNALVTLFECLLRSLTGHDIEFIHQKKSSSQKITLEVTQGETEFIIEVNNKDAYIDIHGLRKRAEKIKFIQDNLSDHAVLQFLLEPSLNKRKGNLGLDGINDYIQSVGGSFRIDFQIEKGSTFEIHLPKFNQTPTRSCTEIFGNEEYVEVEMALIDKLTDLTETLSASRMDMEQQQRSVKNKLNQMEETATQLRDQLHRLKIEVQAQVISPVDKQETEPQELAHFPLIQQLSRNLVEEIDRLVKVHFFLNSIFREMGKVLVQQTHVNTELQMTMMQTQIVPFSKITVRLQKVVNSAAQKLNKKINFVISGDHLEFERNLLAYIVRPIEMILKNAIAYGIEETETRQKIGKSSTAKLLLEITQAASETIIKISDDGIGLDPVVIRKKAEELQIIRVDTLLSHQAVMHFVLDPSFKIERCRGMDGIKHEIEHLGGILLVHSKMTEGVTFEIRLNQAFSHPASLDDSTI